MLTWTESTCRATKELISHLPLISAASMSCWDAGNALVGNFHTVGVFASQGNMTSVGAIVNNSAWRVSHRHISHLIVYCTPPWCGCLRMASSNSCLRRHYVVDNVGATIVPAFLGVMSAEMKYGQRRVTPL